MLHKSIKVLVAAYCPGPKLNYTHVYLQEVGLSMIKECSSTCKALLLQPKKKNHGDSIFSACQKERAI